MSSIEFHPPLPGIVSPRAQMVARWFGIRRHGRNDTSGALDTTRFVQILPRAGTITLIVGGSGSGKSSLLRAVHASAEAHADWIDVESTSLPNCPLVDCFPQLDLFEALRMLSAVGLAEVWTWLRAPAELSDGQSWRLKLALALERCRHSKRPILVSDEFAAVLDRITACVVARTLRKSIVAPISALVATSHEDLASALRPQVMVRCDFGSVEMDYVNSE